MNPSEDNSIYIIGGIWWTIDFSLNVFTELTEFSDKNICHYNKMARACHTATSCVRDQDATTAPARHTWETRSLNWAQFMLQWIQGIPVPFRENSANSGTMRYWLFSFVGTNFTLALVQGIFDSVHPQFCYKKWLFWQVVRFILKKFISELTME